MFDYDGTLAPIMPHIHEAVLPKQRAELINKLAQNPDHKVAIVTGRSLASLREVSQDQLSKQIHLCGTHGAELDEEIIGCKYPDEWQAITERLKNEPEIVFEPKTISFAIHFKKHPRPEDLKPKLYAEYEKLKDRFRLQEGIGVFEFLPTEIHKGLAVDYLYAKYPEHYLMFFGDDLTDNYAHARVNELGGSTYQVGYRLQGEHRVAKELLPAVDDVYSFIEKHL